MRTGSYSIEKDSTLQKALFRAFCGVISREIMKQFLFANAIYPTAILQMMAYVLTPRLMILFPKNTSTALFMKTMKNAAFSVKRTAPKLPEESAQESLIIMKISSLI